MMTNTPLYKKSTEILPRDLRIASGLMPWFLANFADENFQQEARWNPLIYEKAAKYSLDAAEMLLKVHAERQP